MNSREDMFLPNGWAWTTLEDVTIPSVVQDGPESADDFLYVDISSIDNQTKKIIAPKRLSVIKAPSRARQRLKTHDILVSMTRPNLNAVALVPVEMDGAIGSTGFHVLRAFKVSPAFLYYLVQSENFVAAMSNLVQGALYPAVRPKDVIGYSFRLPPLLEQLRIVAEVEQQFSRLDVAIAALERTQAQLKRYRASILQAACEGRLVPIEAELARQEGRTYEPADVLLQRILAERRARWEAEQYAKMEAQGKLPPDDAWKAKYAEPSGPDKSNLPELPEGWCWAHLPQLGEISRGKSKHRPRNASKLYGGAYPFIQTGDVKHSGGYIRQHSQTYSEVGLAQSRLWPAGTLCITIAANIAETGILTYPACFPDSIVGFIHDGATVTVRFIDLFFRTAKQKIAQFAPATAQKNINLETISDLAIPLPPLGEQRRIVAEIERQFSTIEESEQAVEVNIRRAERTRQSILEHAFTGQFVPQDPNDEHASILLERVRNERARTLQKAEEARHAMPRLDGPKRGKTMQNQKQSNTRPLLEVIAEADTPMTPEQLFEQAGFEQDTPDAVDSFYEQLRMAIMEKRIVQERPNSADVLLRAA